MEADLLKRRDNSSNSCVTFQRLLGVKWDMPCKKRNVNGKYEATIFRVAYYQTKPSQKIALEALIALDDPWCRSDVKILSRLACISVGRPLHSSLCQQCQQSPASSISWIWSSEQAQRSFFLRTKSLWRGEKDYQLLARSFAQAKSSALQHPRGSTLAELNDTGCIWWTEQVPDQ